MFQWDSVNDSVLSLSLSHWCWLSSRQYPSCYTFIPLKTPYLCMCPVYCTRDWQSLCKEPDSNCFSPPTHTAPVATAQLCHCGMKAYSIWTHSCVLMNATHGPMFGDPSAGEMRCLPALKRLTVCGEGMVWLSPWDIPRAGRDQTHRRAPKHKV